jgi:hypothetical protein
LNERVLLAALIAFYVLLPLDIGFPRVPLFGHPLNSAIAATLIVFISLIAQSGRSIFLFLREPYSIVQLICCYGLVLSALRSASAPVALHSSLLYASTFLLNYLIFRHVTRRHGIRWLSPVVVAIGVTAAAVAISRAVAGIQMPWYDKWYLESSGTQPEDYSLATARAAGTMNNAILYGLLMVLVLPYALDLKRRYARVLAVLIVLFAAGLSGSRTIVVGAVYAVGAAPVYRWRSLWIAIPLCLSLIVGVAWIATNVDTEDSRAAFLLVRAGFRSESATGASAAALGVNLRRDVVVEAFREMNNNWGGLTWLFGKGYYTAGSVGIRLATWYNSVDNLYVSVLYERGIVGLFLLVGAFAILIVRTRHASTVTLHWYSPLVSALAGFSFAWDAYSTFNILLVGSMAVAMWHEEQARRCLLRSRRFDRDEAAVGSGTQ